MDELDKIEMTEEVKVILRQEQARLIKLIDALVKLEKSQEWAVLKELVFDKSLEAIQRQITSEALAVTIDINKLYKLQGEWAWAKQYSDTNRFVDTLKKQLEDIKKRLK